MNFLLSRVVPGLSIAVACLAALAANAQDVRIRAGFLGDSIKIGEQVGFYVTAEYPKESLLLFPDSTSNFFPFEYADKVFFPTVTRDSLSRDSAVYYLTTFEVERLQYLYLPLYLVHQRDCTEFYSPTDSLLITQMVASFPDSVAIARLPLVAGTTYEPVSLQFNYWFLIMGVGILLILVLVTWFVFGARIRRWLQRRSMTRNYQKFVRRYDDILTQLRGVYSVQTAESALTTWKKYMEQLEAHPYTKLTTRETLSLLRDETLGNNLRQVDRAIYGHDTAVLEPLEHLKTYAHNRFSRKLQETMHGERIDK